MKKLWLVLFIAMIAALAINAQSDCGNCWTVWVGCDPLAICDFQGLCDVCSYFIECDYAPCSTTQAQWACVCPPGVAAPTAACLNDQIKRTILKQKLLNRAAMRNLEMRNDAKRHSLLLAVRTSFLR